MTSYSEPHLSPRDLFLVRKADGPVSCPFPEPAGSWGGGRGSTALAGHFWEHCYSLDCGHSLARQPVSFLKGPRCEQRFSGPGSPDHISQARHRHIHHQPDPRRDRQLSQSKERPPMLVWVLRSLCRNLSHPTCPGRSLLQTVASSGKELWKEGLR